jgi:hypothetical protein
MTELVAIAGSFACVERLKAKVADHGHQAGVDDERRVLAVTRGAKRVGQNDDGDERDDARDGARAEDEDRVADSAVA